MRYVPLVLALLLCSCATAPQSSSPRGPASALRWELRDSGPLFLLRGESEKFQIVAQPIAPYQELTRQEYKAYHIPSRAVLAAYSWHAGYGDVVYILRQPAAIEVYRREMDESETSLFPAKRIYTLPL